MKLNAIASVLLVAAVTIVSCKKDDKTDPNNPGSTEGSLFVRLQQGLSPEDDTVYHISYDASNRIKSIIDSTDADTLLVTYSSTGNPEKLSDNYGYGPDNTYFTYNAGNQLTQIDYNSYQQERYVFEYTNNVISKQSYYLDYGNGLNLRKYYTYVVTNGNITSKKEYDAADKLVSETTYTYSSDANIFKQLAVYNFYNRLGLDEVGSYEALFNNNLLATSSVGGVQTNYTYTLNSNKHITKFVVSSQDAILTRMLSY